MEMKSLKLIAITFYFLLGSSYISSTLGQSTSSPILFIYDSSGSMWGKIDDKIKKEVASNVLSESIKELPNDQKIGLISYGHRKKGDCADIEFLVDIQNEDKALINAAVNKLNPIGKTPLAASAKLAINNLKSNNSKATIILITDGIESCDGDLCEVVRLAKKDNISFKLHIIGFGLKDEELASLQCAAKEGGGKYFDAKKANDLGEMLDVAVNEKVDDPKPNHSFYATKNGKPVDAWIQLKNKVTQKKSSAIRTYQDTGYMHIPIGEYEVTINPLEGTDIVAKNIYLSKKNQDHEHVSISFDGGNIDVFVSNNKEGWDSTVKVIDNNTNKPVSTGRNLWQSLVDRIK